MLLSCCIGTSVVIGVNPLQCSGNCFENSLNPPEEKICIISKTLQL